MEKVNHFCHLYSPYLLHNLSLMHIGRFNSTPPENPTYFLHSMEGHFSFQEDKHNEPGYGYFIPEETKAFSSGMKQSTQSKNSPTIETESSPQEIRKRKKSFIDLEQSHSSKIFKMIRN